mgnify:CR=1 FL=1
MPAVIFIFMVGIAVGYWLCRAQLRGKFILAKEEMDHAVSARLNAEWIAAHPPPQPQPQPTQTQEQPLSVAWNLPHHPDLIKTRRCPTGFSAKQVLGFTYPYNYEPIYPGGIKEWDATHLKGRDDL